MSEETFESLTLKDKIDLLFIEGREILQRREGNYVIKLYVLHKFLAELWYRHDTNRIEKIRRISITAAMDLYQGEIDLSDLFR